MVDYSKWGNIEISDDEDDTHPNIDTPSLFRWRHRARLDRMEEMEKQKETIKRKKQSYQARLMDVHERMANKEGKEEDLKKELEKIEKDGRAVAQMEKEFQKKQRTLPWNVDTISKPGFEKTCINKKSTPEEVEKPVLPDDEIEKKMKDFLECNEDLCKDYGLLTNFNDSKLFLQKNSQLVCEETTNYMIVWALNLAIEEKFDQVDNIAQQCVCLQYILELGKQLRINPKACVASFFTKIQTCASQYLEQFRSDIQGLRQRLRKRAEQKLKEIADQIEAEEKRRRLGPGGLDPEEVFATLPFAMQRCFETKDIALLQTTIAEMPLRDAKYHMQRCVDAGLWIPTGDEIITKTTRNGDLTPEVTSMEGENIPEENPEPNAIDPNGSPEEQAPPTFINDSTVNAGRVLDLNALKDKDFHLGIDLQKIKDLQNSFDFDETQDVPPATEAKGEEPYKGVSIHDLD